MNEIWKPVEIEYFKQVYKVSNLGRFMGPKGRILKTGNNKNTGYLSCHMCYKNKHMTRDAHRVVAITFIPNPENLPYVNHINGNKHDNRVENLEWINSKDSMKHAMETGLRNDYGSNSVNSKLKAEDVLEIRKLKASGKLNYKETAKKYGIHKDYVTLIANRKRWAWLK